MIENKTTIRPLAEGDLEQAVKLDAETDGLMRNDFFQRRWRALKSNPQSYVGLVAAEGNTVIGFVLGHILTGEFGTRRRLGVIDSIAVSRGRRGKGVGTQLMDSLKTELRGRECSEIRTVVDWEPQDLLEFFARSGFSPAPVNVLEKRLEEHWGQSDAK